MRILSITVGGFRNIEKTTFELGGIVGLVSANNYGKTNVLDAISFAIDFMQASLRERSNMMGVVGCMPLSPKLADDCFTFAIELEDPDLGEYRFVRYGFFLLGRKTMAEVVLSSMKPLRSTPNAVVYGRVI